MITILAVLIPVILNGHGYECNFNGFGVFLYLIMPAVIDMSIASRIAGGIE